MTRTLRHRNIVMVQARTLVPKPYMTGPPQVCAISWGLSCWSPLLEHVIMSSRSDTFTGGW